MLNKEDKKLLYTLSNAIMVMHSIDGMHKELCYVSMDDINDFVDDYNDFIIEDFDQRDDFFKISMINENVYLISINEYDYFKLLHKHKDEVINHAINLSHEGFTYFDHFKNLI